VLTTVVGDTSAVWSEFQVPATAAMEYLIRVPGASLCGGLDHRQAQGGHQGAACGDPGLCGVRAGTVPGADKTLLLLLYHIQYVLYCMVLISGTILSVFTTSAMTHAPPLAVCELVLTTRMRYTAWSLRKAWGSQHNECLLDNPDNVKASQWPEV